MRRPVQGAFRRSAIADMGPVVRECMEERVSRWRSGEVVELMGELGTLERTIRTRILFGDQPPAELQSMLARRRRHFRNGLVGLARRPGTLAPGGSSMMEGERQLARAIEARRREPTGDLLSALVASGIPSSAGAGGGADDAHCRQRRRGARRGVDAVGDGRAARDGRAHRARAWRDGVHQGRGRRGAAAATAVPAHREPRARTRPAALGPCRAGGHEDAHQPAHPSSRPGAFPRPGPLRPGAVRACGAQGEASLPLPAFRRGRAQLHRPRARPPRDGHPRLRDRAAVRARARRPGAGGGPTAPPRPAAPVHVRAMAR